MTNNLMKLTELAALLEYNDMRSVRNWCDKNGILIASMGKAKYVASEQIKMYFDNKFKRFANQHYSNPEKVIHAFETGDKVELSESMGESVNGKVKKRFEVKNERSKAAQDFLNNLKSA